MLQAKAAAMSAAMKAATLECEHCKFTDKAYGELFWLILFKATQGRDAEMSVKEAKGTAMYQEAGAIPYSRRCRITTVKARTPTFRGKQVTWTLHSQDDAQPARPCNNTRLIVCIKYQVPLEWEAARTVLETLRALWDHARRILHEGQAALQTQRPAEDEIEYRLMLTMGPYQSYTGRYTTLTWTRTSRVGPLGERRVPGELAKQIAPGALELEAPQKNTGTPINRSNRE